MSIEIINATQQPLTLISKCASECWGSKPRKQIAIDCIKNGHHRVLEYPDVIVKISGYSARCIRELYTHIIGTTRLQSSTRYIEYGEFDYYTPNSINNSNDEVKNEYNNAMKTIQNTYKILQEQGIKKEDIANILPLGMMTTIVLKINARALIHLSNMRLCNRAYYEIRQLTKELISEISKIDDEWQELCTYCVPKCKSVGYCEEKFSCGLMPKKESVIE